MMTPRRIALLPSRDRQSHSRPVSSATVEGAQRASRPGSGEGASKGGISFWDIVGRGARPGAPGGLLIGWWLWERLARRLWPSFVAPGSPYGALRIRVAKYRGAPIDLPDSTHVERGALVCELHCDNEALLSFSRRHLDLYAAGRRELSAIANWVINSDNYIEAIYGVTLLGSAAARLGFHRRAMPARRRARADRLYMNGLLALYSLDGVVRLKRGHTLRELPQEIWMSRAELLQRYGPSTTAGSIRAPEPDVTSRSRPHLANAKPAAPGGAAGGGNCNGYE